LTRHARLLLRLRADTKGSALVELSVVMPLLLLVILGVLDYGRLYWNESMAQKATAIAVRLAAVRPPACPGVPSTIGAAPLAPGANPPEAGTLCRVGGVCAVATPPACQLDLNNATAAEIWDRIRFLLPPDAEPANVQLEYTFDGSIGFLGGPFSPIVTSELINLEFSFVSPLGQLAAVAASDGTIANAKALTIPLPSMSASIPGEDMASGAGL
jgi:hypothetical protein